MTTSSILYVDDDIDDLLIVSEAFLKHTASLKVIHASNGLDALHLLHKMAEQHNLPCLIILDINMPVMNGRETLKKIKAIDQYRNIPIVMFSTSINKTDQELAANMGADYVIKPMDFQQLEKLAAEFIEKCGIAV
ncbi:MAG: response regulator [Flavisolibacter sp.]